jgi:hypothetical protein
MTNFNRILRQLQLDRGRAQKEVGRLDAAIAAFGKLTGKSSTAVAAARPARKRRLSAAARRRIAQAQKVRWAKYRQQQGAKA